MELIQGLRENDSMSQKLIFQKYYGFVMSITLRYTRDKQQAEEVLNDSFMKIFSKINLFNPKESFEPWLAKVVVNTSLDFLRKQSKTPSFLELTHQEFNTEEDLSNFSQLNCDRLLQLIQELPPQYKAVFNLYVFEGYKHKEIAQLLDISESTSKSNYSRAKQSIKKKIGSKKEFQQLQLQSI